MKKSCNGGCFAAVGASASLRNFRTGKLFAESCGRFQSGAFSANLCKILPTAARALAVFGKSCSSIFIYFFNRGLFP